jgi:hypothetical protein
MKTADRILIALLVLCVQAAATKADENGPTVDGPNLADGGPVVDGPRLDRPGLEMGARYWYSSARNDYSYYGDTTTSMLVSRLSYDGMTASSGELYFRGDVAWGFFIKGFIGGGTIGGGHLTDEDFCQTARKVDPRSASNFDPSIA